MASQPQAPRTWCMWGKAHSITDPAERTHGDYCRTHQQRADREAFALNALIRAAEQCEHCAAAVHAYRVARGY
jgi:hypothetical protein